MMTTAALLQLVREHVSRDPLSAPEIRKAIAAGHNDHPETTWAGQLPEKDIWLWSKGTRRPVRHRVHIGLGKVIGGLHIDCLRNGIVYRINSGGVARILGHIGDGTWYDSEYPPLARKA